MERDYSHDSEQSECLFRQGDKPINSFGHNLPAIAFLVGYLCVQGSHLFTQMDEPISLPKYVAGYFGGVTVELVNPKQIRFDRSFNISLPHSANLRSPATEKLHKSHAPSFTVSAVGKLMADNQTQEPSQDADDCCVDWRHWTLWGFGLAIGLFMGYCRDFSVFRMLFRLFEMKSTKPEQSD
jgi:hypothetical protein